MGRTVSVDTPLAEITLRKYERPQNLDRRELSRKLVLSLGLLQPGDSRDVIVDVLQVLLEADEPLTSKEVEDRTKQNREDHNLPMKGVASSNIRRQLLRLRDLFLVEKVKTTYRMRENATLAHIFEENLEQYYIDSIMSRVKEYLNVADEEFDI
jgi:repressor of nif and glnA expression